MRSASAICFLVNELFLSSSSEYFFILLFFGLKKKNPWTVNPGIQKY